MASTHHRPIVAIAGAYISEIIIVKVKMMRSSALLLIAILAGVSAERKVRRVNTRVAGGTICP